MNPLIIYHANCADGMGAAWAAYRCFGAKGAEYQAMQYNDKRVGIDADGTLQFPFVVAGRAVYILDFSFTPAVLAAIAAQAHGVVWLDHHKTAFEAFGLDPMVRHESTSNTVTMVLDPLCSGCTLAWEHFHPSTPTPWMLRFIEDRDLWQWRYPETRNFATALRSFPLTLDCMDQAHENTWVMIAEGKSMNRLYDQQLADIVKRPIPIVIDDKEHGLAVNCTPQFASEGGGRLAEMSGTFGATWAVGEHGQVFVSLRSQGDYNVETIAKRFGGGGHMNAAGFRVQFRDLDFQGDTLHIDSGAEQ